MKYADQAICLRAVSYSETSQILTLLTREHGKLSVMARGAKRAKSAFDGPVEPFSIGDAVIVPASPGRELATLAEFQQSVVLPGLRKSLSSLNAAFFAAELTEKMTETQDPHPELFDALRHFLTDVQSQNGKSAVLALLIVYQLTLLNQCGIGPVFVQCTNCPHKFSDRWKTVYFSSRNNGLLCGDCQSAFVEKRRLSLAAAAALSDLKILKRADEKNLTEIESLLIYHFTGLMHKPPRTARYFYQQKF